MRKILIKVFIFAAVLCSFLYLSEEKQISAKQEKAVQPKVNFHFNWQELYVGFNLAKAETYDEIEYVIKYSRGNDTNAVVEGSIDNSCGKNAIQRENIILGSCSSGGTCIYDIVTSPITLTVRFFNTSEGNKPKYTITKTLYLSQ